jgi:hypothetical protein
MKATTIKLDGVILEELERLKRPQQNLTSFVRDLLKAQIHRHKMVQAAEQYAEFLRKNADESTELDVWATAPLDKGPSAAERRSQPVKARRQRKGVSLGHVLKAPCTHAKRGTSFLGQLVPIRRLQTQQVMHEEVLQQALAVGATSSMSAAGNRKEIEFLVRFDQSIRNLHRG